MSSKRKWNSRQRFHQNPSRGGPAILLTCEAGREVKCEREGRAILQYYLDRFQSVSSKKSPEEKKLSLDEELSMLQKEKNHHRKGPFQLFDTGCSGTVFLLFKDESDPKKSAEKEDDTEHTCVENSSRKRIRSSCNEVVSSVAQSEADTNNNVNRNVWDPIRTVRDVLQDLRYATDSTASSAVPGSRFVTRMIPIQTTCFTSTKNIELVLPSLLQDRIRGDGKTTNGVPHKTFCIHVKIRNFNQLSRQDLIDAAVPIVTRLTDWTVKLEAPDFVVWIEVCKNLMGVSVLCKDILDLAKNLNIMELRNQCHKQNPEDESTAVK